MPLCTQSLLLLTTVFLIGATTSFGHGHMTYPPSTRHGGSLAAGGDCLASDGACYWFTNNQAIPGEPLLNDAWIRSINGNINTGPSDWSRANPWRAPGTAPVLGSGCGVAGGGPVAYANGGHPPDGIAQGADGLTLAKKTPTVWPRGSVQEVGMAVSANHAGGYSWRLCKNDGDSGGVNEACFEKNVLQFAGTTQFIVYTDGKWSEIQRVTVTQGTHPAGSEWARFPVPSCDVCNPSTECGEPLMPTSGMDYGSPWNQQVNCNAACAGSTISKASGSCPGATQFPEPLPGMSGFGKSIWHWSVVDRMQVPEDMEPGDYLLSLRWDCEQSDQVFQNCADIEIVINGSKVGQPPIVMDPSMELTTYTAEGSTKCNDELYEDACQGKDNGKDVGAECMKLDEKSCSTDASCELVTKEGKKYCWVAKNDKDVGAECLKLDEQSCSTDASCEMVTKEGKTYCWMAEPEPEPEPPSSSSSNGHHAMAVHVIAAMFGLVATILL